MAINPCLVNSSKILAESIYIVSRGVLVMVSQGQWTKETIKSSSLQALTTRDEGVLTDILHQCHLITYSYHYMRHDLSQSFHPILLTNI
jgi:hypothetical protein